MRNCWSATVCAGLLLGAMAAVAPADDGPTIDFTFDKVDVNTFVKLVGEITGKRFVVGDDITGKITVVSPRITPAQVYPLFVRILESAGCSVQEDDDLCRIVALPGRASHLAPVIGIDAPTPETGVITKVLRLTHVRAGDVRRVLSSQADTKDGATIRAMDETNHLIVTDTAANVRRIERLIAEIDQPGLARSTQLVQLRFATAEDLAEQLNTAMSETESRAERLRARLSPTATGGATVRRALAVAAPHSNSLILVGSESQVTALRELIAKMDIDLPTGRGRLNAIFLRYLGAEEAAESITALLTKSAAAGPKASAKQIAIQGSAAGNALLVDASPGDFEVVKRLIDQLDTMPQQVQIDVVIMEVSRSSGMELGIELAAIDLPSAVGDTVVQGGFRLGDNAATLLNTIQNGVFPRGLSVGVAHGSRLDAAGNVVSSSPALVNIDALRKAGVLKVLSQTSLQAQNNKEATIKIVDEIPILKSTIAGGSGTARDVIQNIDRVDVGIKLTLTPHIIPGGQVSMELNPSIEAVIDPGPDASQFAPTIAKREVKTTVSVEDGRTIVIAGLTREDAQKRERRVPILGSIPLLGWLFRSTSESTQRTDLLIFVTPQVVHDMAVANRLRTRLEGRTGLKQQTLEVAP
jgi:general secretion pathway protein D